MIRGDGQAKPVEPLSIDPKPPEDFSLSELPSLLATNPRPFWLPERMSLISCIRDPVMKLRKFNYKVEARIGLDVENLHGILTVVHTGAGPILIMKSAIPHLQEASIDKSRELITLHDANGRPLSTTGIVQLSVVVSKYRTRAPFIAVHRMSTDANL